MLSKVIYFLGDSITYGHDDLIYGGYVNQVRNELDENKFNIVNCGVSGDRVIDLINRLDYIFNKERKTLTDYIFNVYKVDIENKRIYKTSGEYIKEMSKYDSKFLSEDSILLSKDE